MPVLCRIGLVTVDSTMWVTMANSDWVACSGVARTVAMRIGTEDYLITCFSFDLGRFDLIFGVEYLHTLGPILQGPLLVFPPG